MRTHYCTSILHQPLAPASCTSLLHQLFQSAEPFFLLLALHLEAVGLVCSQLLVNEGGSPEDWHERGGGAAGGGHELWLLLQPSVAVQHALHRCNAARV
eukprot:3715458-Prymnesium_polylepis.1